MALIRIRDNRTGHVFTRDELHLLSAPEHLEQVEGEVEDAYGFPLPPKPRIRVELTHDSTPATAAGEATKATTTKATKEAHR